MPDEAAGCLLSALRGLFYVLWHVLEAIPWIDERKLSPRAKVIYTLVVALLVGGWIWLMVA